MNVPKRWGEARSPEERLALKQVVAEALRMTAGEVSYGELPFDMVVATRYFSGYDSPFPSWYETLVLGANRSFYLVSSWEGSRFWRRISQVSRKVRDLEKVVEEIQLTMKDVNRVRNYLKLDAI